MIFLVMILTSVFPLTEFPDSTQLTITNNLTEESIEAIHLLLPGNMQLIPVTLEGPIHPGAEISITVPYSFMERIVFTTTEGNNYRETDYAPTGQSPGITVSLAQKEFGGFFDVILGLNRFVLLNETPVPLSGIYLHEARLPEENIMSTNPVLPSEIVFLWLNCDTVTFHVTDIQGNSSCSITCVGSGQAPVRIRPSAFLTGLEPAEPGTVHVVNCINGEQIEEIEIYPAVQEPFLVDLTENPLLLWQSADIPVLNGIDFIVCIDSQGRTYSLKSIDQETNAYLVDWWNLDFDFSFPDRGE